MKQIDETTVVMEFKIFQVERIRDPFGRVGTIAAEVDSDVQVARRTKAQATVKAPDDALIPVTVELTMTQARTILKKYAELGGPTDHAIYMILKTTLNEE